LNAPVTTMTKLVGAGPDAARSQTSDNVDPVLAMIRFAGGSGAPEQAPGTLKVTAFDEPLDPDAFTARSEIV
jgi:hypothetical protein